jgi:hypothetical protein
VRRHRVHRAHVEAVPGGGVVGHVSGLLRHVDDELEGDAYRGGRRRYGLLARDHGRRLRLQIGRVLRRPGARAVVIVTPEDPDQPLSTLK